MIIHDPRELGACLQNQRPCESLVGCETPEHWAEYFKYNYSPYVSCARSNQCGRGMCYRYATKAECVTTSYTKSCNCKTCKVRKLCAVRAAKCKECSVEGVVTNRFCPDYKEEN